MSVASKIVQIMSVIGAVKDDKTNTYQNYSYVSADAMLTVARKHMSEIGLVCLPAMTNITVTDTLYLVSYEFTLIDPDEPENVIVQQWAQSIPIEAKGNKGPYLDDKAIGKATTYAHRYFLMKLFLISDRDETDIDGSDSENQYTKGTPIEPKNWEQTMLEKRLTNKGALWEQIKNDIDIRFLYQHENHLVNTMKLYTDEFGAEPIEHGLDTVKANLLARKEVENE